MQPSKDAARIRVVLADDHDLVRSGIAALLRDLDFVELEGEAGDGEELVRVAEALSPDVVLTDIDMPRMDGLAAIRHLQKSRPKIRCLVVSMSESAHVIRQATAAGAAGYILKTASAHELGTAIRAVMERGNYFSAQIAARLLAPAEPLPHDALTERQIEILKLLAEGLSAKEIAYRLSLSSKTIDAHRTRIMERLEINDMPGLTRYAVRHRMIDS
jgi:DNA-binding NarL/FixJ family response regulator